MDVILYFFYNLYYSSPSIYAIIVFPKYSLAWNSLGRGLFYVVNVLRYFKVV